MRVRDARIARMMVPEAASARLFLALWPAPETVPALLAHAQAWSWTPEARRTVHEHLHITIHFLGSVPVARLDALRRGLAVPWTGCDLALDRAIVWPGGIAVLEATQVPPALAQLHAALAERLLALDLQPEARPYRPHVTLARKAVGAQPPAMREALPWPCGPGYALVRSHGGGRGYETLQAYG